MKKFSSNDLRLLEKACDALSGELVKVVLAEIDETEEGYEWVAFAIPLETTDNPDEYDTVMQIGGPDARLIGSSSFNKEFTESPYAAAFISGIQIGEPPFRYTRIDASGDEVDWSNDLDGLLPYDFIVAMTPPSDEEDDIEEWVDISKIKDAVENPTNLISHLNVNKKCD